MSRRKKLLHGILDNSSYGVTVGDTEFNISPDTEQRLRKTFNNSPIVTLNKGNKDRGDTIYLVKVEDTFIGKYELGTDVKTGRRTLVITANPTKLAVGSATFPVVLSTGNTQEEAAFATFKAINRLPYTLLEKIPSRYTFRWPKEELRAIELGNGIRLSRFQLAWYSGNLENTQKRDEVLDYLRICYGGLNAVSGRPVKCASDDLGISLLAWSNSQNITLKLRSGNNKLFSLTIYKKDDEPENNLSKEDIQRVETLLRFDLNIFTDKLASMKLSTLATLEPVYFEKCSDNGFDRGFVRWIAGDILDSLKMPYILNVDASDYFSDRLPAMYSMLDNLSYKDVATRKMIEAWLNRVVLSGKDTDIANTVGINRKYVDPIKTKILETTGIDITVSRDYHDSMLFNAAVATMTAEQREAFINSRSNMFIDNKDLLRLDKKRRGRVRGLLLSSENALGLRGFKPTKLASEKDFHVYKLLRTVK